MRGAAPFFVALLAIMGCAMVLAEEEGQPMTEYLKEGILRGGRRASTAAGAYSWGSNDGASSNRAGNDEALYEASFDLGEPNAPPLSENGILKIIKRNKELEARNKELEAQTSELRQKVPRTSRDSVVQTSLDLAQDVGEAAAAQKKKKGKKGVVEKVKKALDDVHKKAQKKKKAPKKKAPKKKAPKKKAAKKKKKKKKKSAAPSAKWSEDALKVAKLVHDDWAESTEGEARCKALLAKAKECHKKGGNKKDCELADRTQFQTDQWVKKRYSMYHWNKANWYRAKGYNNFKPNNNGHGSVLVHRAGLRAVSSDNGNKVYVCASWTAVCTQADTLAKARCRSARIVLGGGKGNDGFGWVAAEAMANHPFGSIRIVLPQFG